MPILSSRQEIEDAIRKMADAARETHDKAERFRNAVRLQEPQEGQRGVTLLTNRPSPVRERER